MVVRPVQPMEYVRILLLFYARFESHTHSLTAGICGDTSACDGVSIPGKCPGASNIQCCIHKSCAFEGINGNCQRESTCTTDTKPNLCPGSSQFKCCMESSSTDPSAGGYGPVEDIEEEDIEEKDDVSQSTPVEIGEDQYPVLTSSGSTCEAGRQQKHKTCMELHPSFSASCGTKRTMDSCPQTCVRNLENEFVCDEVTPSRNVGYFQSRLEAPESISRKDILERALVWLNARIRYSQIRYHSEPSIDGGLGYRTDCSGFVGMAWKGNPSTHPLTHYVTLTHIRTTVLAFSTSWVRGQLDSGSTTILSGVACKDMLPGDAIVNSGHIALFRKWISKRDGSFLVWEEKGTAYGTVEASKTFTGWSEDSTEMGFKTKHSSSVYRCLRRANLAPDQP
jgi:hypothetical protein